LSIAAGVYFFVRIFWYGAIWSINAYTRASIMGIDPDNSAYSLFYFNTSTIMLLAIASILLIVVLVSIGSAIGTSSRRPPATTPLFLIAYSVLTPLWFIVALYRAIFRTGVQWR